MPCIWSTDAAAHAIRLRHGHPVRLTGQYHPRSCANHGLSSRTVLSNIFGEAEMSLSVRRRNVHLAIFGAAALLLAGASEAQPVHRSHAAEADSQSHEAPVTFVAAG